MNKLLVLLVLLTSCSGSNPENNKVNQENVPVNTRKEINKTQKDSLFIVGDFLFEGNKDMKFEFVKLGEQPKTKTKGDTLYSDKEWVLLGDFSSLTSEGIFKKLNFKSNFSDFKVEVYDGKLANPNFASDPSSKNFITRIKDGCRLNGVNFAGHYTLIVWGCGGGCDEIAIVDRIDGAIIYSQIPFKYNVHGIDFKIDSRRLVINTEYFEVYKGYYRAYWRKPAVYEITNGELKKVE